MRKVPCGLLDGDRVVVHAEGVGHERLAEQGSLDQRPELELEEVSVEIVDDVGSWKRTQPLGLPINRCEASPRDTSAPSRRRSSLRSSRRRGRRARRG